MHPSEFKILFLVLLLSCAGCDFQVTVSEKNRYSGAGIIFEIPLENSDAITGTPGITYQSERFTAETNGKNLTVNGKNYGALNTGDIVDFYEYPTIKVNGEIRRPEGS